MHVLCLHTNTVRICGVPELCTNALQPRRRYIMLRGSLSSCSNRALHSHDPCLPCSSCTTASHQRCRVWSRQRAPVLAAATPAAGSRQQEGAPKAASKPKPAKKPKDPKEKAAKAEALALKQQGACYGCGAPLQMEVPGSAGYVAPQKYAVKKRHKQLHQVLCERCSGLCNGAMIPAVEDFTQKVLRLQQQQQEGRGGTTPSTSAPSGSSSSGSSRRSLSAGPIQLSLQSDIQPAAAAAAAGAEAPVEFLGKLLISPEELKDKLLEVRGRQALVVLLVDLLDASATLLSKVRDMVGKNPIVLVGTKMDLLPRGARPKEVADWLMEAALRKRLNVTSTHLVSSHTGEGIAVATSKITRERKGRDVFVVGAANVGKSAFVRAMLKEMGTMEGGNFDAAAMAMSKYLPVESAMPGTTLGLIPLQAFQTGGTLYDTPGVHLHHRVPHMLTPEEVKLLHPRRQLKAYVPDTPADIMGAEDEDEEGVSDAAVAAGGLVVPGEAAAKRKAVSATYLWSGLARLDVLDGPPSSTVVFYSPATMRVYGLPLLEEGQSVDFDLEEAGDNSDEDMPSSSSKEGSDDTGASSSSSSRSGPRVLTASASVQARGGLVPHDLVVKAPIPTRSCLADIAISGIPGWVAVYAPFYKGQLRLRVWAPRGVEVFLRPPLPSPSPLKESSDADGMEQVLGVAGMEDMWAAYKQGLDLKALGLEGEEEAVKQLLFGSGMDPDEQSDWYEAAGEEGGDDNGDDGTLDAAALAAAEEQVQQFVGGITIPWEMPEEELEGGSSSSRSKRGSSGSMRSSSSSSSSSGGRGRAAAGSGRSRRAAGGSRSRQ